MDCVMMWKNCFWPFIKSLNLLWRQLVDLYDVIIAYMSDVQSDNNSCDQGETKLMFQSYQHHLQIQFKTINDAPTPMEIDATRRWGPLSNAEKQHHWANRLCLYCGGPGHIAITCPHKPKWQVNQVSTNKPESTPIVQSNNPNTFSSSTDPC
jgi:hypothetical protein